MTSTRSQLHFDSPGLPRLVCRLLQQVDRRLRIDRVLRGLGITTMVAALGAAIGMAVDLVLPVPAAVRWGLWGGWLATVGLVLALRVVAPLVRRLDPLDLAAVTEQGEPRLGERLTATVGLLGRPGRLNGSPALVAVLAQNASAYAGLVDAAAVVSLRSATRWVACGGLALALVVAPSLVWPDPFRDLGRRFLAPWANLDRVGWFALDVRPGDASAALGADFLVSVRVAPRLGRFPAPADAWLEWTDENGGITRRVAMPELKSSNSQIQIRGSSWERAFVVTLPRLAGSLRYRVESGGAVSRSFRVKAIEPPSVVSVEAKVEPPAYTGLPSASVRNPERIEAWEGSRITLGVTANRPVAAVAIDWPQRPKPVSAALGADRTKAEAPLVAEVSGPFTLSLRDEQGLMSTAAVPRRLVVRADAPPQVSVQGAEARAQARADDRLRLEVVALDDVAVASVELHYSVVRPHAGTVVGEGKGGAGETSGHLAVEVPRLGTRSVRGEALLALGSLGLKPGDTVSYRVRVADNRPAPRGPNVVWSPVGSLAIVAVAEPLLAQRGRAEREAIQAKLDALKAAAAENRKETEQLRYAADAVQRDNGLWDRIHQLALTRREAKARELGDRLHLLARELDVHARFQLLAQPARQIAEGEAETSRALLGQARDATDPARRFDDLRQADLRLAAVSSRLDDLQRRFDALVQTEADLQQLQNLAEREEAIARQVPGPEAVDPAQLDRLRADQAHVQKDLESLLNDSPRLRAEDLDKARETMRQAARQLDATRRPDPGRDAVQAAKQALDQAADELNAAARHVAGRQGREEGEGQTARAGEGRGDEPASESGTPRSGDPRGALATPGTLDLDELKGLIRSQTGRAWGELPGHLRTEILQMSQSRYRDEYARLIQLYFQEIATGDSPRP